MQCDYVRPTDAEVNIQPTAMCLIDCLSFSSDLARGVHAPRASSGEAVRRENEGLSRLARGHLHVSLFFLDGPRKKRDCS